MSPMQHVPQVDKDEIGDQFSCLNNGWISLCYFHPITKQTFNKGLYYINCNTLHFISMDIPPAYGPKFLLHFVTIHIWNKMRKLTKTYTFSTYNCITTWRYYWSILLVNWYHKYTYTWIQVKQLPAEYLQKTCNYSNPRLQQICL